MEPHQPGLSAICINNGPLVRGWEKHVIQSSNSSWYTDGYVNPEEQLQDTETPLPTQFWGHEA